MDNTIRRKAVSVLIYRRDDILCYLVPMDSKALVASKFIVT